MRVLVTALGSIAAPFVATTLQKEMGLEVIGVDMYPAAWVATSAQVEKFVQVPPLVETNAYEQAIVDLCRSYDVRVIVPLTDIEVDFLSARASRFEALGAKVATSKPEAVSLMRNKMALHDYFQDSGLLVIPTYCREQYLKDYNVFPCVAKRVDGRSSEGLFILEEPVELELRKLKDERYVFQPFLHGSVLVADILKINTEKSIYVIRRELTRTKSGAGITVQILNDDDKSAHAIACLSSLLSFEGCINVEFLCTPNGELMLMDVNPRFSAGVAFSALAGYNFVLNHVAYFLGQTVQSLGPIKYGEIYTRKYTEVTVRS